MDKLLIAVDVGRSSCKTAFSLGGAETVMFQIPSLVSTSHTALSAPSGSLVNSFSPSSISQIEIHLTAGKWLEGMPRFFMFGEQAILQGKSVSAFSEGAQFHKYGVAVILYSIARALVKSGLKSREAELAINLTYANSDAASFYKESLAGGHDVSLGVVKAGKVAGERVSFTIKDIYCFSQGFVSIFNFLGKADWDKYIKSGRGVAVDIGRFSIDFSLVQNGTLVRGDSSDFGIRHIIDGVVQAAKQVGVVITSQDVERSFIDRGIEYRNVSGAVIKPWDVVMSGLLDSYFGEVSRAIRAFIGDERVDYMVLCGGGSILLHERLYCLLGVPILPVKEVMANCLGMVSMLRVAL